MRIIMVGACVDTLANYEKWRQYRMEDVHIMVIKLIRGSVNITSSYLNNVRKYVMCPGYSKLYHDS